jgi:hypothetical protein
MRRSETKLGNNKSIRKINSIFLACVLFFSSLSFALGADINTINVSNYTYLTGSDFENGETWGFIPGGGAAAAVVDEGENKYLEATGSGSGGRSIVKTLDEATTDSEVLFTFDWKPGNVSTAVNSSEILFSDSNDNPIFRLVKAGGTNGEIKYGVGTTGTDLTQTQTITEVSYDESWLSVKVLFDFNTETVSMRVHDKNDDTKNFAISDQDFSSINYVNSIAKILIKGNRASGNNLSFETGLDNIFVYGSGEPAPNQGEQNIVSIETEYNTELNLPKDVAKEEVIAYFPNSLDVKLGNDVILNDVNVHWDSIDYDSNHYGVYSFTGILDVDSIPNVSNEYDIKASISVITAEGGEIPEVEGYDTLYYSDFGDTVAVVPVNWGFTTANASLSINTDDVGGNITPKLKFSIENQSGGRVIKGV